MNNLKSSSGDTMQIWCGEGGLRGGSRTGATFKMEPLTITTKRSILDVAAALDDLDLALRSYFSEYLWLSFVLI